MTLKVFVDCSKTYLYSANLNTGVQRVVRNIIRHGKLLQGELDIKIVPVSLETGVIKFIDFKINSDNIKSNKSSNIDIGLLQKLIQNTPVKGIVKTIFINTFLFKIRRLVYKKSMKFLSVDMPIKKGDVLLLPDNSWHLPLSNIKKSVEHFKYKGGIVIGLCHDIIPITYPRLHYSKADAKRFINWINFVAQNSSGFIAVSNTVKCELQEYINSKNINDKLYYDSFLLGSDFNKIKVLSKLDEGSKLKKVFENGNSTYLIVSTIEPRKNHKFLLDVFDALWNKDIKVNLCIVGKFGWMVKKIKKRILKSRYLNKKLFVFNRLNDQELAYCYKNSKALVFPSIAEGFGLPIIESLQSGLPVLASDTRIHNEVGGKSCDYFSLDNPTRLAERIEQIEQGLYHLPVINFKELKVVSWEESIRILITKLLKMHEKLLKT